MIASREEEETNQKVPLLSENSIDESENSIFAGLTFPEVPTHQPKPDLLKHHWGPSPDHPLDGKNMETTSSVVTNPTVPLAREVSIEKSAVVTGDQKSEEFQQSPEEETPSITQKQTQQHHPPSFESLYPPTPLYTSSPGPVSTSYPVLEEEEEVEEKRVELQEMGTQQQQQQLQDSSSLSPSAPFCDSSALSHELEELERTRADLMGTVATLEGTDMGDEHQTPNHGEKEERINL